MLGAEAWHLYLISTLALSPASKAISSPGGLFYFKNSSIPCSLCPSIWPGPRGFLGPLQPLLFLSLPAARIRVDTTHTHTHTHTHSTMLPLLKSSPAYKACPPHLPPDPPFHFPEGGPSPLHTLTSLFLNISDSWLP